jgi:solute carrier family 25 S-adenosylmethionine transporter 26
MNDYTNALLAGAIAGTFVDTILFPLDTIKTRLQSKQGFLKSGGFKSIYSGLSSAVMGSSPSAALFFLTYETLKKQEFTHYSSSNHMISASIGEIVI